jgi:serine/threonine-protein kinase
VTSVISPLATALADRYRIERELGHGGMATVYLAHDLKHDRDVAIKVLHPELGAALGSDRFLSEIRTIARLQHPHILPLLDSGDAGDLRGGASGRLLYYVMPYVNGETLRARLIRERQLSLGDALHIAREVADALAHAHAAGIIHRDIKPENVLLAYPQPGGASAAGVGHALVADFGIALAVQQAAGQRLTQTGLSLGTPQYMSPEQAMGEKAVDARTDVYALGAVLYEMLAGEPPFTGSSAQAIVAKVLTERPTPLHTIRDTVPLEVEHATLKALAKLPADRFATATQFADALTAPVTVASVVAGAPRPPWLQRHAMPIIAALGVLTAVSLALAVKSREAPGTREVSRFSIALGTTAGALTPIGGSRLAWAPDGKAFAYVGAAENGGTQVWIRSLDALTPTPLPGTEGGLSPFFSPDGQQVGFVLTSPFSLRIVPRAGGRATVVTSDGVSGGGGDWSTDGYIYFDGASTLSRIRPDGSGREVISALDTARREIGLAWPSALPNGRGVIFRVRRAGDDVGSYDIVAVDLKTRKRTSVVKAAFARYVPSGHLLYVLADGSLMAARFDLDDLQITGVPLLITAGLGLGAFGAADVAVSSTGSLLYATGRGITTAEPLWVDRSGAITPVDSAWRNVFANSFALSPDGSRLALHLRVASPGSTNRAEDIWVKRMPTGPTSRLTTEGEQNRRPSWSHDGRDVLFLSSRSGPPALYRQRADGSAPAQRIAATAGGLAEGFESPDGRWVILRTEYGSPGDGDILAMQIGRDSAPAPLIATRFREGSPTISPDGRWIAYVSEETDRSEVYVRPFPDVSAGRIQISTAGGAAPRWSHTGRELFFVDAARDLIAAEVRTSPSFSVVRQTRLFSTDGYVVGTSPERPLYDVSADDRRFLLLRAGATAGARDDAPQTILVQHFVSELARLLP